MPSGPLTATITGPSTGVGEPTGAGSAVSAASDRHRTASPALVGVGVVVAALAVALVVSLPASLHLGTQLIGTGSDPDQNVWNVAWVRGWLDGHHGLYFTHQLLYPEGANLAWMTLALPSAIVAALLVPVLGLVGAYNLALLLTLAADGAAMYLLARRVGLGRSGAAVAGLAFETGPYLTHELVAHLHMVGAYPIPLALGVLWGILERPRPSRWRFVLLGAVVALAAYDAPDYALYALLAGIVMVLFHPAARGRVLASILERWWGWLCAGVVALGLVAPFLDALIAGPLAAGSAAAAPWSPGWTVDLVTLFVPPPAGEFRFLAVEAPLPAFYGFPGFFALAALVVLFGWRRRILHERRGLVRLCLVGMATFVVLSLGAYLHVDGHSLPVPLPYLLLAHLPGFADTLAARLTVLVAVFSSLLVGLAVELVVAEIRLRRAVGSDTAEPTGLQFTALRWVVVGFLLLELSIPYPFPFIRLPSLAFASSVRRAGGTVLFVPAQIPWSRDWEEAGPYAERGYWYMYADAEVGLPTPEGYASRLPVATSARVDASAVLDYVTLMQLTNPQIRTAGEVAAARALPGFLRRMDVHSVVFRATELAHPGADVAWFAVHADVSTHLSHLGGGIWVLRLGTSRR